MSCEGAWSRAHDTRSPRTNECGVRTRLEPTTHATLSHTAVTEGGAVRGHVMDKKRVTGWPLVLIWLGILGYGVAFWFAVAAWLIG